MKDLDIEFETWWKTPSIPIAGKLWTPASEANCNRKKGARLGYMEGYRQGRLEVEDLKREIQILKSQTTVKAILIPKNHPPLPVEDCDDGAPY